MKRRLLVVIGTRPEAIKLAPVVHALRAEPWAQCRVLVTAQHRQMLDQMLAFFQLRPDRDLDLMLPGQSLADLTARMVSAMDPVLAEESPELVIGQGDTTTVMVAALCAFYRRIRFAHVEAGLRTGDKWRPFPEEANRSIVSRLADLHFAPTDVARQNLLREGVAGDRVHLVGNTVIDALQWASGRVDASKFAPPPGCKLLLVTAHRRENVGAPLARICTALRALADRPDVEILYPVHPNPQVRPMVERLLGGQPRVRLCEPLDYPDMVAAMQAATLLQTDSGGIQEEASSLGKPVLVLREATDRPEAVAAGAAWLVGADHERIVNAANGFLDAPAPWVAPTGALYGDGHSAQAIVGVLHRLLHRGNQGLVD